MRDIQRMKGGFGEAIVCVWSKNNKESNFGRKPYLNKQDSSPNGFIYIPGCWSIECSNACLRRECRLYSLFGSKTCVCDPEELTSE